MQLSAVLDIIGAILVNSGVSNDIALKDEA